MFNLYLYSRRYIALTKIILFVTNEHSMRSIPLLGKNLWLLLLTVLHVLYIGACYFKKNLSIQPHHRVNFFTWNRASNIYYRIPKYSVIRKLSGSFKYKELSASSTNFTVLSQLIIIIINMCSRNHRLHL